MQLMVMVTTQQCRDTAVLTTLLGIIHYHNCVDLFLAVIKVLTYWNSAPIPITIQHAVWSCVQWQRQKFLHATAQPGQASLWHFFFFSYACP